MGVVRLFPTLQFNLKPWISIHQLYMTVLFIIPRGMDDAICFYLQL
jgi:hypothetical protein